MRVSENLHSETVRKVPTGSELKPHKSTKRSKKPNLGASGTKNVGFSGYSRPFSDSFTSRVLGNSKAKRHKKRAERRSPALELHVLLDYREDVPVRVPEKRHLRITALRYPVLCL